MAKAARADALAGTWVGLRTDRVAVILDAARGRRVLDIGCVSHDPSALHDPRWLHRQISEVADLCVGLDHEGEGVARMVQAGFHAVAGDLDEVEKVVREYGTFEVVVAGELIEHLDCPRALFDAAGVALEPAGRMVITTPNPYAPWRVRLGQRCQSHENVDHVTYMFPSGIVELCERTGFRLVSVGTTHWPSPGPMAKAYGSSLVRRHPLGSGTLTAVDLLMVVTRRRRQMGETSIYIVERRV